MVFKAFDTTFEEDWFKGGFLGKYRCYFEGLMTILPECDWLFQKGVWIVEFVGIWLHQLHFSAVILGTSFLFLIACLVEVKKGSISLSLENSTLAFTVIIAACQVMYLISCSCFL